MADFTGTNGDDNFFFQGVVQNLSLTVTDAYTGDSFLVDDEFNLNTASYEGLAGIDTLFMTNVGDAFFIRDPTSDEQMAFNIEVFFAGDGGDVIQLSDDTYTLGDVEVVGGLSDDLILSNVGDDVINGNAGADILYGGPGNDHLIGDIGDDTLNGGDDADFLDGGADNDTLMFHVDGITEDGWFAWNVGSPGVEGTSTLVNIAGTNMSLDVFDGGDGFDTIVMTDGDDAFFLDDPYSEFHPDASSLRLIDVEQIDAGLGNDVIDLTHTDIDYGDIIINGGAGDDHLWSASGDDVINGGTGNDHIFGGFGIDLLRGDDGDDEIYGSLGNDRLEGGAGNDILFGGAGSDSEFVQIIEQQHIFNNTVIFPDLQETISILDLVPPGDDALGIAAGDLSVDFSTTAEVSFVQTVAGFNNSLGFYNITLDGTIQTVDLAFPNVKDFSAGDTATINLPGRPDTDFGFFTIANGDRKNDFDSLDLENGTIEFIFDYGGASERLAKITDDASDISLVHSDGGCDTVINGHIYHTTPRGGGTNLNHDNAVHVVSGIMEGSDAQTLRIGFEDLPNLGDADYNDVVFDITVQSQTEIILLEEDGDVLIGGAGNDIIDGGIGDDLLVGGEGLDELYGEQGSDTFLFQSLADAGDSIMDFESGIDGDIINITDILEGFDTVNSDANDFMALVTNGSDVELHVNADGAGNDFTSLLTIVGGVGGAGLSDLLNDGNLVVDQSISV